MKITPFLLFLTLIFLSGCSTRQYFDPDDVTYGFDKKIITTPSYIKTYNSNGATTQDNRVLNRFGISKFKLPLGYEFLNYAKNGILAANKNGKLLLFDQNITFEFKSNVVAATQNGDMLALVFANNSFGLYNIKEKSFKLKKYEKASFANDIRIASPVFFNRFILFPTLNGKVQVVNKNNYKVVKTLTIDPKSEVNNIILLKIIDDVIIAASPNKLVVINNGKLYSKKFFIQSYLIDDKNIYIATLDGRIIKYDLKLKELNSKKFKFAKIQALAIDSSKNIYAFESAGYLIKLSNDFKKTTIYNFPLENDEIIYTNGSKVYFENKVMNLN